MEQDKQDLEKLMSKINFDQIQAKRQGLINSGRNGLKKKSTISSAEFMVTFGGAKLNGEGSHSMPSQFKS